MSDKPTNKPKLSPTQAKVVKAKIRAELEDIPQYKVAQEVFPHQTPGSAAYSMSTELRKPNVREALQEALAAHDLTAMRIAEVVSDAMSATKTVVIGKEEDAFADQVPDHGIRLKAAGMAGKYLGLENQEGAGGNTFIFNSNKTSRKYVDA